MKPYSLLACLVCSLSAVALVPLRADTLGEILEDAKLSAIIGTWVDQESKGEKITMTYAWRIKDHALGLSVMTENRTSEALIGVNPKTGEVVHTSVDSKGGAGIGTWKEKDGVATLTLLVSNAEGEEIKLKITQQLRDDNKQLVVGMKNAETEEGGEGTLVRKAK